jgi:Zn-dependent protease with chaperone function
MIERAIQAWKIKDPLSIFRYRIMTLILPVSMFPLYNLINLNRNSIIFREETALLNINRWLTIEIWDIISVGTILLIFLLGTSVIFFLQEVIPIIKDSFTRKKNDDRNTFPVDRETDSMATELSNLLGIEKPSVKLIRDRNPVILTSGTKNHSIVISSGLISVLDKEQRYSAIAHELAHIMRRSNATTWAIFIIRILMFFNPIALIVFRRIIQDDEHICDDITVSLTRKPFALADTLKVFYSSSYEKKTSIGWRIRSIKNEIESHSHDQMLTERIARLQESIVFENKRFQWGKFILTVLVITVINYYVI